MKSGDVTMGIEERDRTRDLGSRGSLLLFHTLMRRSNLRRSGLV
jgi:hypothetical protein